jgi:hypothetical protein
MMALKYLHLDSCDTAVSVDELLPKPTTAGQGSRAPLGPGSNVEERGFTPHPVAVHYLVTRGLMLR